MNVKDFDELELKAAEGPIQIKDLETMGSFSKKSTISLSVSSKNNPIPTILNFRNYDEVNRLYSKYYITKASRNKRKYMISCTREVPTNNIVIIKEIISSDASNKFITSITSR